MNDTLPSHIWAYPIVVKVCNGGAILSERAGCDEVGALHTFKVGMN